MSDFETDFADIPFELEALIEDAIGEILSHEDPQLFIVWMREHIYDYYTGPEEQKAGLFDDPAAQNPDQIVMDSNMARSLAANFASMIWNGIPLPSNNFKPRPMTMPTRNDPCHCGSGKKYKHCCALLPNLPRLSPNELWPILFEKLDKDTAARAIRENHVPLVALNMIAQDYLESDLPKKAVALLKPLFEGAIRKTKDDAEFAMTLLCNAYDYLGYHKIKSALLRNIIGSVARSPLRSGAWQRQATICIDNDDTDGAWNAFTKAQRDDPDSISLSILEVQILNSQGLHEKTAARADFWVHRLRRAGLNDDEMPLNFLLDVVENPARAFTDMNLEMVDDAGLLLLQWLESVVDRPVPEYSLGDEMEQFGPGVNTGIDALHRQLLSFGMEQDQIEQALQEVKIEMPEIEIAGVDVESDDLAPAIGGMSLQTPDKLKKLELDWHRVYLTDKPFSVHDAPFGDGDPWDREEEIEWSDWLQDNPVAFDSLDILDDLATALLVHPQFGATWLNESLLTPILQRAEAIIEKALAATDNQQLHWIISENRPGLRALSRLVNLAIMAGQHDESLGRAQRMISINPHDNHGHRMIVMNELIRGVRDREALSLAENFPDDIHPEIAFGRVLVLYRLGRRKEAVEALGDALEFLSKIPRFLLAKRIKKPKLNDDSVLFGGDDQAWYYREEMRGVWQNTPGALDWLKNADKAFS